VGGCCGTTEKHIRAIAQMAEGKKPRHGRSRIHRAVYSGIETIEAEESTRPLMVGERTNVIGSRLFKNLVAAEQWEEATEIARRQVKSGAHIVDVCLQSTERDEKNDIPPFYEQLIRKIKAPIMIDTTDPRGGAGADVLPGQEHHQFDQLGRWRRKIRARSARWRGPTARR
jgi:5-methyltetrahydrofolate--homocysteine methyltransferase